MSNNDIWYEWCWTIDSTTSVNSLTHMPAQKEYEFLGFHSGDVSSRGLLGPDTV